MTTSDDVNYDGATADERAGMEWFNGLSTDSERGAWMREAARNGFGSTPAGAWAYHKDRKDFEVIQARLGMVLNAPKLSDLFYDHAPLVDVYLESRCHRRPRQRGFMQLRGVVEYELTFAGERALEKDQGDDE